MPQRKRPKVQQEDIDEAVNELMSVLDIDSLSEVDKFFALDLLQDYGKWCGIAGAAWRSILEDGLTERRDSGAANNRHRRMVKSESIDIFKLASASKTALASKISRFVKNGIVATEEEIDDGFDDF